MQEISNFEEFFKLSKKTFPRYNQENMISMCKKLKAMSIISGNEFTVYSIFLKKIGGRNYAQFLRLLEVNGIITRSTSYQVGRNCKKLKIGRLFDTLELNLEEEKLKLLEISESVEWKGKYKFLSKLEQEAVSDNLKQISDESGEIMSGRIRVDPRSNRVYSDITRLPKNGKLYVYGRRMIEIDGSATFPTILCKFVTELSPYAKDVKKLQDLIKSGNFYNYMADKVSATTKSGGDLVMSAKESAQWWINFDLQRMSVVPSAVAFTKEFPTAGEFLKNMKKEYSVSRKKAKYSTDKIVFDFFSEVESDLWVKNILIRLTECGIICATKHDSVFVDRLFIDDAMEIVNEVMREFFGEFYNLKSK